MRYVEAPEPYTPRPGDSPAIFLAGGITGCPDWQRATYAAATCSCSCGSGAPRWACTHTSATPRGQRVPLRSDGERVTRRVGPRLTTRSVPRTSPPAPRSHDPSQHRQRGAAQALHDRRLPSRRSRFRRSRLGRPRPHRHERGLATSCAPVPGGSCTSCRGGAPGAEGARSTCHVHERCPDVRARDGRVLRRHGRAARRSLVRTRPGRGDLPQAHALRAVRWGARRPELRAGRPAVPVRRRPAAALDRGRAGPHPTSAARRAARPRRHPAGGPHGPLRHALRTGLGAPGRRGARRLVGRAARRGAPEHARPDRPPSSPPRCSPRVAARGPR